MRTQALEQYVFGISRGEEFKPKALAPIVFTNEDLETIDLPYVDPLMIKLRIGDAIVSRALDDRGSSKDIIFWSALRRMGVDE